MITTTKVPRPDQKLKWVLTALDRDTKGIKDQIIDDIVPDLMLYLLYDEFNGVFKKLDTDEQRAKCSKLVLAYMRGTTPLKWKRLFDKAIKKQDPRTMALQWGACGSPAGLIRMGQKLYFWRRRTYNNAVHDKVKELLAKNQKHAEV